jgi:hypothetical protein
MRLTVSAVGTYDAPVDHRRKTGDDVRGKEELVRNPLRNKVFKVHLIIFLILSAVLIVVDLLQSEESNPMLFGLHWAPMVFLPWSALVLFHGFASMWGAAVDEIDDVRAGTWV